jgi:hypothetical protein
MRVRWRWLLVLLVVLAPGRASAQAPAPSADNGHLPVSLDRIRSGLKKNSSALILNSDLPADFKLQIIEQARIDDLMSKLDFKSGPAPAGGLYAYEQQRIAFNPVDHPLMQPYAAFNGGQLITIALENLIGQFIAKPLIGKAANSLQQRSEREAQEEVAAAIDEYCAQRPDRADIVLCTQPRQR